MCGDCGGACEKGVPVPDMLRFLAYVEGYGQFAMARERFLQLPDDVRQIRCRDCRSCTLECPSGVDVRSRLIRAQALLA
jgi:predicted aldo/keto reductase-like oxidoreductase